MKIAINSTTLSYSMKCGLPVYIENLINKLAEIDQKNEYFLLFNSIRRRASQMPGPENDNFHKVVLPIPNMKFPFKNLFSNKIIMPYFLKKNKCDIYHAPWGFNLPKVKGVKRILTTHDLRTLKISDQNYPQDIKALKQALKLADACIAISENTKKDILEYFNISPDKIRVIYNGVDERFKPITDEEALNCIRRKYGLSKKYFFSVGAVPRKNVERLIKAFNLFKYKNDFSLIIGGEGSNGPWSVKHKKLISKLRLENIVRLIGYIPDKDLPLLYNASECFVFPSLYEGFGIPILEGMGCGVPVITSNVSSLPEVGADAALYVNPYDENDIAKAMERIVEDERLKNTFIEKGFTRVKQFSWRKMAEEILQLYNEYA